MCLASWTKAHRAQLLVASAAVGRKRPRHCLCPQCSTAVVFVCGKGWEMALGTAAVGVLARLFCVLVVAEVRGDRRVGEVWRAHDFVVRGGLGRLVVFALLYCCCPLCCAMLRFAQLGTLRHRVGRRILPCRDGEMSSFGVHRTHPMASTQAEFACFE